MTSRLRLFWMWMICAMLCSFLLPGGAVQAVQVVQTPDGSQRARVLFDNMTAEERVGQLFLVTFRGRDVTTKDSKILDLIANRHIGGVVLRAANDNFTGSTTILEDVLKLNADMQTARWSASQKTIRSTAGYTYTPRYVPLLIGMAQEGDLSPNDQLLSGLTALPSGMALGATWNTKQAERVGGVLGNELSILGFNLLLGPSLDLAESPEAQGVVDLGVRVLGGNPFWVGEMGRAYIRGLHQGSSRRLAVVARSFPGIGEADRPAEEEVATVRKTLEQLKQTDLAPFFAVTGSAGSTDAMTDGLLVSNIRYQGLQGVIRPATRPLSFDTAALDQLLALPDLARWRQAGGVVVSDNLGSAALRKFYESTGQTFDPRQLARSAFLGGSDLLYSDNLLAPGDVDSYATLGAVLDFFIQKYREDPAFAQRVDLSVQRILTLKYKLYGDFALDTVNSSAARLKEVGQSQQVVFDLARQAVTLIHPTQAEISQVLPRPPELRERMLFLTDVVTYRQCSSCTTQPALAVDALQNVVARLYGPRAGGQINPANLSSYSFLDLKYYLDESKDKIPPGLEDSLKLADWVVVALVNTTSTRPEAQAFRQMLSKRPELLRNKKIVVFTFNTPYGLDATDISKVNAYYALYSKTLPFIEVAARILFQELTPGGALPVSVPGAGYDLQSALAPDPGQVIALEVDLPVVPATTPQAVTATPRPGVTPSATPTVVPTVKMGDMLPLRTGVIYDHNHFPVPDGTLVKFIFTPAGSEGGVMQQINATTVGGIARASYRIQNGGSLEVRVISEPALTSQQLRLNISLSGTVAITAVIPPTLTYTPTPTSTPTLTSTPTPTLTPTSTPPPPPAPKPGTGDWFFSLLVAWGMGGAAFLAGRTIASLRWGVRWGLLTIASGMFAYTYLVVGLPGGKNILDTSGMIALVWLTLLGALLGWLAGFAWHRWGERDKKKVKIG